MCSGWPHAMPSLLYLCALFLFIFYLVPCVWAWFCHMYNFLFFFVALSTLWRLGLLLLDVFGRRICDTLPRQLVQPWYFFTPASHITDFHNYFNLLLTTLDVFAIIEEMSLKVYDIIILMLWLLYRLFLSPQMLIYFCWRKGQNVCYAKFCELMHMWSSILCIGTYRILLCELMSARVCLIILHVEEPTYQTWSWDPIFMSFVWLTLAFSFIDELVFIWSYC